MGKARIRISPELVVEALHMPAGTKIEAIHHSGYYGNDFLVIVDAFDLPDVPEGSEIPLYVPTVTRNERYTWDWGKPK